VRRLPGGRGHRPAKPLVYLILYAVEPAPLREVDQWLERFVRFWTPHLDALGTELARGRRDSDALPTATDHQEAT
jgi:hypothetical protein